MSETKPGISRRRFIDLAAGAAGATFASAATPLAVGSGVQGANDRIRLALIGSGNRGRQVAGFFMRHPDCQYVAVCDVRKQNLDQGAKLIGDRQGAAVDVYEDYRQILSRNDVDAVHIATPDHWHCQMVIDAINAGKDVYVEKPLSNALEPMVAALQAVRKTKRVVQVGTQQRSGQHFQDAAALVQNGELGKVTHAVLVYSGTGYGRQPEPEVAVPEGLNWDLFQGPAPRRPFKAGRLAWRGWWDYGGGLITDWGVHLTDIALWYLNAQNVGPMLTSASAQYVNLVNPDHDQSPDAFVVSWQYPGFVMSFSNAVPFDWEFDRRGNYFFGPRGSMLIHRQGYEIRPPYGGGRAGGPTPQAARRVPYVENYADDPHTMAHCRNFLDCVKSRQQPVSNIEVGFYATLPTVLGVMAVRHGRTFKWDDERLRAV
jgi:predicted dehydrogenase